MNIDIEKLKQWTAGMVLSDHADETFINNVSLTDLVIAIKALEEAKRLLEWSEDGVIFGSDEGIKEIKKQSQEWLKRYFADSV